MKRGFFATGALALSLMLAACGGAPASTGDNSAGTTGTAATGAGESATGMPATEPTASTGAADTSATSGTTGANPTSATGAGTTGTTTAGTSATSGTTGANPTSATGAGTTGTTTAGTSATSGTTGTNPTSATGAGTTGTTTAGTSATSGTTGANPTSATGAGTTGTTTAGATGESALEALMADPQFSTLAMLLSSTGLDQQLEAAGPVTIFAPTDEAFAALPEGTLAALSQDPAQLAQILRYHVAEGTFRASDITQGASVPTLEGEDVTLSVSGSTIRINDTAVVVAPDITAGASVIHAIDEVLLPSTVNLPAANAP